MKSKPVNHDRTHYQALVNHAKQEKIKVKSVTSKRILDYAGMNPDAAKQMHYNNIGKREILIDTTLPLHSRVKNLRHEICEFHEMEKGKDYFPAHRIALKFERKLTPWEKNENNKSTGKKHRK